MPEQNRKWIVKDGHGRIFGPFSTAKVLQQIDQGVFSGQELISVYPGGKWIPISKEPEFYDKLLDALAAEAEAPKKRPEYSGITPVADISLKDDEDEFEKAEQRPRGRVIAEDFSADDEADQFQHVVVDAPPPVAEAPPVIEMTDMKVIKRKQKIKIARLPLILIVLSLLLAGYYVLTLKPQQSRIHLLVPRAGQPELAKEKVKEKFRKAIGAFQLDTFSGYRRAENELVQIIEGSPRHVESLGLLCLTYRELWTFAFQDSKDLAAVKAVSSQAKQLEPVGINGITCDITNLLISGKYREAKGLVDSQLATFPTSPVLFEIKAEMYTGANDFFSATNYYDTARKLWPNWIKLTVQEARSRSLQRQYPKAMELYREVLTKNPGHATAKIELGIIEVQQFKHYDLGFDLIKTGLDSGERISKTVESTAYLTLAQIYLQKNERSSALSLAKKAYAINPANVEARRLVVSIGGADGLKNTKVENRELLYLGDQYVKKGDHFAAQAEYKAAFEYDPKNGTAALKAAKSLWQLNQSGDAIQWLRKAIQADPKLTAAYVTLADYYSQRFDFLSAIQTLRRILSIDPKNYEVYRGFALVELRRNNLKGAIEYAQKAFKLYNTDVETYNILAEANLRLENYAEAFRFSRGAVELDTDNVEAQSLFARVKASYEGIDAGIEYLNEKINRYPNIVDYRIAKSEILLQEERLGEAEDELRQVLSFEATNKKAHLLLGKVLAMQPTRVREALEIYLRAAALDPSDANPLFLTGQLYMQSEKWLDAITQFKRVIKINERFPLAHYSIGRAALLARDPQTALVEAQAERRNNPDLSDAYLLAAEAYMEMRQYANCAAEYQKAVGLRQQSSGIYVKMARCYRLSGAVDSAASLLRQAAAMESGNADIYKEQGALYQMRGQTEPALEAYNQYLLLAPTAPDRAAVQMEIRKLETGN